MSGSCPVVFVSGEAGVGKTRLAEESLNRAGLRRSSVARVTATRAAAALPLGALAPLLPRLDVPDAMLLPAARDALLRRANRGARLILLVDDAHYLDGASAALVHQLTLTGQVTVVVVVRREERWPDPLTAMWKDERAVLVQLQALPDEDMDELVSQALPGPVDPRVRRELRRLAAGNPLALRELVMSAALRFEGARGWSLVQPLAAPSYLMDVVAGLSPEAVTALRLLALGEPMSYGMACGLAGEAALAELESADLIRSCVCGVRREIGLAHPLAGEAALKIPTQERRRLLNRLADAVTATGMRRRTDLMRVVGWKLDAGEIAAAEDLLCAATTSLALHDLASAVRFASAAKAVGGGVAAGLTLGHALARQGHAEQAEEVFKAAMDASADPKDITAVGVARSENLFSGLEDWSHAESVIAETAALVAGTPYAQEVRVYRARMLVLRGETAAALELTAPLLRDENDPAYVPSALVHEMVLPWDGRPLSGLDLGARASAAHQHLWNSGLTPWSPSLHESLRVMSLLYSGRLADAGTLAGQWWDRVSKTDLTSDMALALAQRGHIALNAGEVATARSLLRRSADLYAMAKPSRRRQPLALLLEAELHLGNRAAAEEVAMELKVAAEGPVRNLVGMEEIALAWLDAAEGRLPEAERRLRAVAGSSPRTVAVEAVHALARLGRSVSALPYVAVLREGVEGPFLAAKLDLVEAAAAQDPWALAQVAEAFETMGGWLAAAEAWAESSRCHARLGDHREATRMREQARLALGRCQQASTPMVTFTATASRAMTDREREIALLAADGLSSKQIAERLQLSRRTVDNCLQQCYRKLGITRRSQIKALIGAG